MGLLTCLKALGDMSPVARDRWLFREMLCKSAEDCSMSTINFESVGSETAEWAGEDKLFSALLYHMC